MIVTCTSCKTKFRLDSSLLKAPSTKVRCSMCGSVFEVSKPDEEDEVLISLDDSMPGASSGDSMDGMDGMDDMDSLPSFDDEEDREIPAPPPPRTSSRRTATKKKKGSLKPLIMILLLILVLGGGGAGYYYYYMQGPAPEDAEEVKKAEELQPRIQEPELTVQSTREYFLENEHAGQIFVVEGEVVNGSTFPVSFVLIEGKLYATDNQVAQTQKTYCGNIMGREELSRYTVAELQNVMMNREGANLTNVHIMPKSRVPFMLVFYNLPDLDLLSDYSVEAISAEADSPEKGNGKSG